MKILKILKILMGAVAVFTFMGPGPALVADQEAGDAGAGYLYRIEMRSVVTVDGETLFSLRDPEEDRTFWISVGQESQGIEAVAYDEERRRLTLRYGDVERAVELSRVRTREVEATEPEVLSPERRREEWRALREQLGAIRGRWESAAAESPELREIEAHFRELGEEIRDVMIGVAVAEEGSEDYRRLTERRRELSEEFGLLFQQSVDTVETHPGFEPGDSEALRRARRLLPEEWR